MSLPTIAQAIVVLALVAAVVSCTVGGILAVRANIQKTKNALAVRARLQQLQSQAEQRHQERCKPSRMSRWPKRSTTHCRISASNTSPHRISRQRNNRTHSPIVQAR